MPKSTEGANRTIRGNAGLLRTSSKTFGDFFVLIYNHQRSTILHVCYTLVNSTFWLQFIESFMAIHPGAAQTLVC